MTQELTPERRRELMAEGRAAFNRGEFYEAHEHWEEVWLEVDDPDHRWIQGPTRPASRRLGRALDKLSDAPDTLDGIQVSEARRAARHMREQIDAGHMPDPRGISL